MADRRKTPIMGWASWNCFRTHISKEKIREQIDALIESGLKDCGYEYVNIDDGFFGGRDGEGNLQTHRTRFPNGIKVIADYAHEKGLKAGIYSESGDNTCGFYYDHEGENGKGVGLYGYEDQDLKLYLETYGFDFIKVDWCGGLRLGLDKQEQYSKIGAIIDEIRERTGRQIVYNVCCWEFPGASVGTRGDFLRRVHLC
ncbi:MAG: glycoside hydrolase family 27 protein [Lachnospiraceae bacterium]|nr:glycoside hydrolase family 27 protein [Lachnospiraceae bacterium]